MKTASLALGARRREESSQCSGVKNGSGVIPGGRHRAGVPLQRRIAAGRC